MIVYNTSGKFAQIDYDRMEVSTFPTRGQAPWCPVGLLEMEKVVYDYNHVVGSTDKEEVLETLVAISQHDDVISSHRTWEDYDQQWKDSQKDKESKISIMKNAALTRESKKAKDSIHDAAATLACEIAEESGVLIDYDEDTLGDATVIDGVPELSADWHNLRRKGIGGSSVSKVLGFHWMSHNGSPIMVDDAEREEMITDMAIEKMTPVIHASIPQEGVLYRGHQWEPVSLAWLSLTHGYNVAVSKKTWRGKHPLQVINVDGIIVDDKGNPEGIVECKTSSRTWTWQWGVPTHYRAQVLWYLNATGLDYAKVVVRFDDGTFDVFSIDADETVDGTDLTEKITSDAYMSVIEKAWEDMSYYMDNHDSLWSQSPRLRKEKKDIRTYYGHDNEGYFVTDDFLDIVENEDFSVISCDLTAPYERMDESFTIPVSITINNTTESVSGAIYPLYDTEVLKDDSRTAQEVLEGIESTVVIAQDSETFDYLHNQCDMDNVIHISALARLVDDNPGKADFSSYNEVIEWIDTFFE